MVVVKYKFKSDVDTIPTFNVAYDNETPLNYHGINYSDVAYTGYTTTDVNNGDGTITRTIEHTILPTRISFQGCTGLLEVLEMNTSNLVTLAYLFWNCSSLTYVNCANWDVSKVRDLGRTFSDCYELTSVDLTNWDVSNVQSLFATFDNSYNFEYLGDLSNWDTSNVISMYATFDDVVKITDFNIGNWDTSNVVIMRHMFAGNNYGPMMATSIDISNWDTSKVTDMQYMFYYCEYVEDLDLSGWDTSNVTNMDSMFKECSSLKNLDLSGWDITNLETSEDMFLNCNSLSIITMNDCTANNVDTVYDNLPTTTSSIILVDEGLSDSVTVGNGWCAVSRRIIEYIFDNTIYDLIPSFNTSFTNFGYTDVVNGNRTTRTIWTDNTLPTCIQFGQTYVQGETTTNKSLSLLEVLYMETSDLTTCGSMFRRCENLTELYWDWNASNVMDIDRMFEYCINLSMLDVTQLDVSNVEQMSYVFGFCKSLNDIVGLSNWNTSNVLDMNGMFIDCTGLTSLDLSNWNTSNLTDISHMFSGCSNLSTLNLNNWDVSKVTNMSNLFYNCKNIRQIDGMFDWDVSNVKNMSYMFSNSGFENIDLIIWDTSNVTDMSYMFKNCNSLINLNIFLWDVSNVTTLREMFSNCNNLTYLQLSSWKTDNVTDMNKLFYECSKLLELDIRNWKFDNVIDSTDMFDYCYELSTITFTNNVIDDVNRLLSLVDLTLSESATIYLSQSIDLSLIDTTNAKENHWKVIKAGYVNQILRGNVKLINGEFIDQRLKNIYFGNTLKRAMYK